MNFKLKASLEAALQQWIDDECDSCSMINGYIPDDTALHLVKACESVFDALEGIQKYHEREQTTF